MKEYFRANKNLLSPNLQIDSPKEIANHENTDRANPYFSPSSKKKHKTHTHTSLLGGFMKGDVIKDLKRRGDGSNALGGGADKGRGRRRCESAKGVTKRRETVTDADAEADGEAGW